ncbi:secretin N-terminal domain-containing protein [Desulfovibrio sp. DV]|uniref:secretin N-terminal domain-containing protein n=1 Tax=Desulfovibrio sp. DV TaxID=1844708 RepID=UPI0009F925BE|nr:secretin N-terminal domain-containing protein [Desulfovibrio sp. DV]
MRSMGMGKRRLGRMGWAALATAVLLSVVAGCVKKPQKDAFMEHWDAMAQMSEGYSPVARPRKVEFSQVAITPKKEEKAETKPVRALPKQRVTLRMYDTDLVAVVRAMARAANQNVVLSSAIPGTAGGEKTLRINVNVVDAPWDETFTSILSANGLSYTVDGDIIKVMTLGDMEQQNKLKEASNKLLAEKTKAKELEPFVMARVEINFAELPKIYATLSAMCGSSAQSGLAGPAAAAANKPGETARDITPTSAAGDAMSINAPGGSRHPGQLNCSVVPDQHSNSIIIQGPPNDAERLVALIEELDKPRPQVKLKAFIVQTDQTTGRQLGVQWGGLLKNSNLRISPAQTGTSTTSTTAGNTGSNTATTSNTTNGSLKASGNNALTAAGKTTTTVNPDGSTTTTTTTTASDIAAAAAASAVLGATGASSNASTGSTALSSTASPIFPGGTSGQGFGLNYPALTNALTSASGLGAAGAGVNFLFGNIAGNVLEAQLTALAEENKVKILSSPTITTMENVSAFIENGKDVPYVSTSQNGTNVQFAHATLKLEMLPHVVDGTNLRMKILVKDDQVDTANSVQGNPLIYKRETQSNLVVEDGDTIVISGLTRDEVSDSQAGVPYLSDIPGLGWAFKTKGSSIVRNEIFIFVTPTILRDKPIAPTPAAAGPAGAPVASAAMVRP